MLLIHVGNGPPRPSPVSPPYWALTAQGRRSAPVDGPFEPFGFRYLGREIEDLSDSPLRHRLLVRLWNKSAGRPRASVSVQRVIDYLYPGEERAESRLKSLVMAVRDVLLRAEIQLGIGHAGGKVWRKPLRGKNAEN